MKTIELIQARANTFKKIRSFFEDEGLIEVDTPLLYPFAASDPYIHHLSLPLRGEIFYLQSSPEFAMKRLLAKAQVPMFQLCKAFRNDGEGTRHKTEFTMLEWYMPEWSLDQLIDQCVRLLSKVLETQKYIRISYRDAFMQAVEIDPFVVGLTDLQLYINQYMNVEKLESFSRDECIHLLFSEKVEKFFDSTVITFVENFPATQAALATCEKDQYGHQVAKRFEIYYGGLELANAYQEESDSDALRKRFEADNKLRLDSGLPEVPIDNELLKAMENFPPCVGIALGVDRLLMLKLKLQSIQQLDTF